MIIAKYNSKKAKAGVMVSETSVSNIVEKAETAVVQKAQQVAAQTSSEIAMTATVNANGELVMTSEVATMATAEQ